jgi:cytochrome c oxidase assembly protein subunit 15
VCSSDLVTPVHKLDKGFQTLLYIVLGMTVVQVAMGTQVREMIDFLNHTQGEARSGWVSALPWFFYVHRTFSAVVLAANIWLVYMLWRAIGPQHSLTRLAAGMLVIVVLAIVSGSALNHLGMPAFVQPTHLLSASLLFGLQFLIWMDFRHAKAAV